MNAARKTYGRSTVVSTAVDHGEIMGVRRLLATMAAGMALRLALGPMTASTLFCVMSFVVAAAADGATSWLSSMTRVISYRLPPTSRPPRC